MFRASSHFIIFSAQITMHRGRCMGREYKSNRISHIRRSEITCDSYLQTSSIDSPLSGVDWSKWVFVCAKIKSGSSLTSTNAWFWFLCLANILHYLTIFLYICVYIHILYVHIHTKCNNYTNAISTTGHK